MGRPDFMEAVRWEELASIRGLRLPPWKMHCTNGWMERWLKRLQISTPRYLEWAGTKALREFREMNPRWPLAAWVGLLLEKKHQGTL